MSKPQESEGQLYYVAAQGAGSQKLGETLTVNYEARAALDGSWFLLSDLDIEDLGNKIGEASPDVERLLLIELTGDISLEGLDDETADWLLGAMGDDEDE